MGYDPIGAEGLEERVKASADAHHERIGPVFYYRDNGSQYQCACDGCIRAAKSSL